VDPAIEGAWIGFAGGIVASLGGTMAGFKLTGWAQRRSDRLAVAKELPELTAYLYSPRTLVELRAQLSKLSVSLSSAGVEARTIRALTKVAEECNRTSRTFALANPGADPAVDDALVRLYDALIVALGPVLQRIGKKKTRANALNNAVEAIVGAIP
jgi:hypothetical protein